MYIFWWEVGLRKVNAGSVGVACGGVRRRREKVRLAEEDSGEEKGDGRAMNCRRTRIVPTEGVDGGIMSRCCG